MARLKYTDEMTVLDLIQENGRSEGFDGLAGCDLRGLNFSEARIQQLIPDAKNKYGSWPVWASTGKKQRDADLERIRIEQSARDENEVAQKNGAYFCGMILTDTVLVGTNFDGADLSGGAVLDNANLRSAVLTNTRLWDARIRDSRLRNVTIGYGTALQHADLTSSSLLGAIAIGERILWLGAILDRTAMERGLVEGHIGEEARGYIFDARRIYAALRLNFESLGQRSDALWAYAKEKETDRRTHFYFHDATGDPKGHLKQLIGRPISKGDKAINLFIEERKLAGKTSKWFSGALKALIYFKLFVCPDGVAHPGNETDYIRVNRLAFLFSLLQSFFWGYGVNPARVLRTFLLSYLIFVGVNWLVDSLSPASGAGDVGVGDYFLFSLLSLATMSWPEGQGLITDSGVLLAGVESAVGILLFAVFVFTLGRRLGG